MLRALPLLALLPFGACQCQEDLSVVPGNVTGRVCDEETGLGIPNVTISVVQKDGAVRESVSDAQGSFTMERLAPGAAEVRADVDTGARAFDVEIEPRVTAVVDDPACRERPGAPGTGGLDGLICNRHTGALVSNAVVTVLLASGEIASTSTDAAGAFELASLPTGAHVVTVQASGFLRSFAIEIVAGEVTHLDLGDDCRSTDANMGTLSGLFCDPADPTGALIGARVTATDASGDVREDVTDTDGRFFLNALAPGPASVTVVRAPDFDHQFFLNVVAGRDTTVEHDLTCGDGGACSFESVVHGESSTRPVDIIFVIDDSGSMDDDNQAVQQNINAFSQSIADSGVDYRVVLIGSTNVPAPLGGSSVFLHIDRGVDSNEPLEAIVDEYGGLAGFMRPDSVKHFVAITDDESDMSATEFTNTVNSWPGFDTWTFHSIVAYGSDPDEGCSTGAAYGHEYMILSSQTGGLTSPICDANYAQIFQAVVDAVTVGSLPCTVALPPTPTGLTADYDHVSVVYAMGSGGTQTFPVTATCASGEGFRFDDANAPNAAIACDDTCALLQGDGQGALTAHVECFEQ